MKWLLPVALLAMAGCNDGTKTGPAPEPPTETKVSEAIKPEPTQPIEEPPIQKKPGHNDSRINQIYELKKTRDAARRS